MTCLEVFIILKSVLLCLSAENRFLIAATVLLRFKEYTVFCCQMTLPDVRQTFGLVFSLSLEKMTFNNCISDGDFLCISVFQIGLPSFFFKDHSLVILGHMRNKEQCDMLQENLLLTRLHTETGLYLTRAFVIIAIGIVHTLTCIYRRLNLISTRWHVRVKTPGNLCPSAFCVKVLQHSNIDMI